MFTYFQTNAHRLLHNKLTPIHLLNKQSIIKNHNHPFYYIYESLSLFI